MNPRVTVVIPLFNKAGQIVRAVSSVLGQTMPAFEVIVIDDGSTDGGAGVLQRQSSDPRLLVKVRANKGKSVTRNEGIAAARADVVAFLDADDEWHPSFLETICALVADFPDAGVFATGYVVKKARGSHRAHVSGVPRAAFRGVLPDYFRCRNVLSASSVAVRREAFGVVGGFCEEMLTGEDLDMWMRLALRYPIAYCSEPCAMWHHEVPGSSSKTRVPGFPSMMRRNVPVTDTVQARQAAEYVRRFEIGATYLLCRSGQRREATRRLIELRACGPASVQWLVARAAAACPTALWSAGLHTYRGAVDLALIMSRVRRGARVAAKN